MTNRPNFLNQNHTNGSTIVEAFRKLSKIEATEVDNFLTVTSQYGSLTWQEVALYQWINEEQEINEFLS